MWGIADEGSGVERKNKAFLLGHLCLAGSQCRLVRLGNDDTEKRRESFFRGVVGLFFCRVSQLLGIFCCAVGETVQLG